MSLKSYAAADLKVVAYIMVCDDIDGKHIEYEVEDQKLWESGGNDHSCENADKCDCCGHWLKYSCILYSVSESKFFSVGRTCTGKITGLQRLVEDGMNNASVAMLERAACNKREREYLEANPTHASIIENAKVSTIPFIRDLYAKLRRHGSLSIKQIDCMERIMKEDKERRENATGTVPVGRAEVEGTIVSFKDVIDPLTDKLVGTKMLVDLGNGVRVYGSKPSALPKEYGQVKFKATFSPSPKDPLFGFFSRPALT